MRTMAFVPAASALVLRRQSTAALCRTPRSVHAPRAQALPPSSFVGSQCRARLSAASASRAMFGSLFGAGSASASAVQKGDPAPDVAAKDQKGNTVSLADFRGNSAVVLFFYPKAFTPGCTKQACAFRDASDVFAGLDAKIIGVSSGSTDTMSSFEKQFNLNFTLLADEDNKVRNAFGVPSTFGILPGRVTYVIDKNGTIIEVFNSQLNVDEHVKVARQALEAATASK